jgi:hypothetical protein
MADCLPMPNDENFVIKWQKIMNNSASLYKTISYIRIFLFLFGLHVATKGDRLQAFKIIFFILFCSTLLGLNYTASSIFYLMKRLSLMRREVKIAER